MVHAVNASEFGLDVEDYILLEFALCPMSCFKTSNSKINTKYVQSQKLLYAKVDKRCNSQKFSRLNSKSDQETIERYEFTNLIESTDFCQDLLLFQSELLKSDECCCQDSLIAKNNVDAIKMVVIIVIQQATDFEQLAVASSVAAVVLFRLMFSCVTQWVAGGAASGKTTVCDMIIEQLHDQRVVLVNQDSFYHKLTAEELTRVHEYNFDHPGKFYAFDNEKLLSAMEMLKHGEAVDIPKYNFRSYKNNVSRRETRTRFYTSCYFCDCRRGWKRLCILQSLEAKRLGKSGTFFSCVSSKNHVLGIGLPIWYWTICGPGLPGSLSPFYQFFHWVEHFASKLYHSFLSFF
ncbi:Phosphoribulokinase/uridine kinase [Cynara cardunculus var. scolymus]|uniref:Phosphoribulokinase/uridine kinase n=1 Tax=Cynara cardunculus var. scolymus TaxID=59895 RepID=A0A103XEF4_CYNCS|nr:Phosphoribulokinase/uridine kinase [Cynara cardunculus var. scolymus]